MVEAASGTAWICIACVCMRTLTCPLKQTHTHTRFSFLKKGLRETFYPPTQTHARFSPCSSCRRSKQLAAITHHHLWLSKPHSCGAEGAASQGPHKHRRAEESHLYIREIPLKRYVVRVKRCTQGMCDNQLVQVLNAQSKSCPGPGSDKDSVPKVDDEQQTKFRSVNKTSVALNTQEQTSELPHFPAEMFTCHWLIPATLHFNPED